MFYGGTRLLIPSRQQRLHCLFLTLNKWLVTMSHFILRSPSKGNATMLTHYIVDDAGSQFMIPRVQIAGRSQEVAYCDKKRMKVGAQRPGHACHRLKYLNALSSPFDDELTSRWPAATGRGRRVQFGQDNGTASKHVLLSSWEVTAEEAA